MSDTSDAAGHLPIYQFAGAEDLRLPQGCELVGVEITDDAVELPSFRHPLRAAYVFGSERLSLSQPVLARCRHVVKIPTRFSINVGMAGAIVMYDRMLTLGRFGERPLNLRELRLRLSRVERTHRGADRRQNSLRVIRGSYHQMKITFRLVLSERCKDHRQIPFVFRRPTCHILDDTYDGCWVARLIGDSVADRGRTFQVESHIGFRHHRRTG